MQEIINVVQTSHTLTFGTLKGYYVALEKKFKLRTLIFAISMR